MGVQFMESKKQRFSFETVKACAKKIRSDMTGRDVVNTLLLLCLFVFYTLTFFVPKFYGMTEKYVGLFVFVILALLALVNINPIAKFKEKDKYFIALSLTVILTGVNILLVNSGFGCFFVMVNFALVWYLSSEMPFKRWQFYLFGILYALMLIYWFAFVYTWMFADYTSFAMNTNTAATFTVFSMLFVFVFFTELYRRHAAFGLLIAIALVKSFQIALYHRSRGAFIMLGAFMVLWFLMPRKLWDKKGFFGSLCVFATLGSLAFVAFYIWLGTKGVNFRMPFFYKNIFSGREQIWLEFWNLFKEKPLTGIGTNVTITSFFEFNVHNAMYNILVIHGLIVFVLSLYLMYGMFQKGFGKLSERPVGRCAMAAVIAVCIESFFDVDLIWTNYTLNVFLLLLATHFAKRDEDIKVTDDAGRQ